MTVRRTYKYRLYDSKQNKYLDAHMELAAEVWNHCIALHRRYYRCFKKHIPVNRMKKHITKLKKMPRYQHWNELGSQAIQDVAERIEKSYAAFFDHVKGKRSGRKSPPKFKKRRNYTSFTLKQAGYKFIDGTNKITIMGRTYKYVKHRPFDGLVKTVTIKRTKTGKYFLCISVVQEWPDLPPRTGNAVGLDFGLKTFLTMDDGTKIVSPEWFKVSLDEVRKAHRDLSRRRKGSNNRERAKYALALKYERIDNRRLDWLFKLADDLTKKYPIICIEDLNIETMKQLWGRKVSDLAFSEFVSILQWEALKNNAQVIKVDRWEPTSKTCHRCGHVNNDLSIEDRQWVCPHCHTALDRDVNAAINIRNIGVAQKQSA